MVTSTHGGAFLTLLPKLQSNCITSKEPVKKRLSLLLTGVLVALRCLVQRLQQLFPAHLSRSTTEHPIEKNVHSLIICEAQSAISAAVVESLISIICRIVGKITRLLYNVVYRAYQSDLHRFVGLFYHYRFIDFFHKPYSFSRLDRSKRLHIRIPVIRLSSANQWR